MFADPDYFNQTIATCIEDSCVTLSAVSDVIKHTHQIPELDVIVDNVDTDVKTRAAPLCWDPPYAQGCDLS